MQFLSSNILPLGLSSGDQTIIDAIKSSLRMCDQIEIAVGYISKSSLIELQHLVAEFSIKKVVLIIGMYYFEGMPESSYHIARRINQEWMEQEIGEIRLVKSFNYHGKLYAFYNNNNPVRCIIGSANLGVIKLEATNLRQYEVATFLEDSKECHKIAEFIADLSKNSCSANLADIKNLKVNTETNRSLENIELVTAISTKQVEKIGDQLSNTSFRLPLKVPMKDERFMDDSKHFTKSNINVCYAAPRSKRKSRDWYETQITVSKAVRDNPGYPEKNKPFLVVTDDGYSFMAHTTSDGNKQFSAVGDELILGRWIKGRLVAAGLVEPVNNTSLDKNREGMITQDMLQEYGADSLVLTKTTKQSFGDDGNVYDVWYLSFEKGENSEEK